MTSPGSQTRRSLPLPLNGFIVSLSEYLSSRWSGLPTGSALAELVEAIASHAFDQDEFVHRYQRGTGLASLVHDATCRRRLALMRHSSVGADASVGAILALHDAVSKGLLHMHSAALRMRLEDAATWDFGRQSRSLAHNLSLAFPGLSAARLKGWNPETRTYASAECPTPFDAQAAVESLGCLSGLTLSMELSQVLGLLAPGQLQYSEQEQGRRPSLELVGALFGFFLACKALLDEQTIAQELNDLLAQTPNDVVFQFDASFRHPTLQALTTELPLHSGTQADLEGALAHLAAHRALPKEEQARIEEQCRAEVFKRLQQLRTKAHS